MRLRPQSEVGAGLELPMTSMIDVVFLLLIFFMVTSSFTDPEKELPSALAAEGRGAASETLEPQVVRVEGDGRGGAVFRLGARQETTREGLARVLSTLPKGPGVIVRVSDAAPVWAAAAAMQAATDAGFEKRTYVPD